MEDKKSEENKMEIEISKYKDLVDALSDPVRVARMVLLIAAVAAILAAGIVAVVCGIKRFYPYKSINSNPYGATIIHDEDNEIIYWLFNTADLWANSGIEVKEGDVISVRTSGAYHTAIHHLVEDANNNTKIRNPWSHSKGDSPSTDSPLYERSKARAKFRIAPDLSQNTILMQVIPSKVGEKDNEFDWRTDTNNACYIDGKRHVLNKVIDHYKSGLKTEQKEPDIYEIGIGKENIRIRTNGILHFAVNDIALTPRVIDSMNRLKNINPERFKALDLKYVQGVWLAQTTEKFNALFTDKGLRQLKKGRNLTSNKKGDTLCIDTISSEEWNPQHFKQLNLIDEQCQPNENEEYWNKEKLEDLSLIDLFKSLKDSTFLNNMYANNSIWRELEKYKNVELVKKLVNRNTISMNDSMKVKQLGYKADSISDNKYQERMGFHNNVRIFYNIWEGAYTKDSISLQNSSIIRCFFKKDDCDCLYSALYLLKIGLLEKVWQPKELDYYKHHNFVDAWFVDNIGSFMIVIERKKVR